MNTIRDLIVSQKQQIAMALPRHLDPDRLIRVTMTALRKNPNLMGCSHASLMGAIIQAAQLGLETDGALGHAYLVPYGSECQLQIGYRGMIDIARRSGQIKSISAHVVYEKDEFRYSYGLDETLEHKPALMDRGAAVCVYAVAKLVGGGYQFEVLSMEQIQEAEKASQARYKGRPWEAHWEAMARKTAIRRLFKYLPVSIEIQRAVTLDSQASAGISQGLDAMVIDIESADMDELPPLEEPEPPQDPMDKLKGELKEKQGENVDSLFSPLDELKARVKNNSKIMEMAKKHGIKMKKVDDITDAQAGILIDILNEEGGENA